MSQFRALLSPAPQILTLSTSPVATPCPFFLRFNDQAKPTKIVAGQEPENTNKWLQAMAKCVIKKMDSTAAVQQVNPLSGVLPASFSERDGIYHLPARNGVSPRSLHALRAHSRRILHRL
jgi:hypothetical protein